MLFLDQQTIDQMRSLVKVFWNSHLATLMLKKQPSPHQHWILEEYCDLNQRPNVWIPSAFSTTVECWRLDVISRQDNFLRTLYPFYPLIMEFLCHEMWITSIKTLNFFEFKSLFHLKKDILSKLRILLQISTIANGYLKALRIKEVPTKIRVFSFPNELYSTLAKWFLSLGEALVRAQVKMSVRHSVTKPFKPL